MLSENFKDKLALGIQAIWFWGFCLIAGLLCFAVISGICYLIWTYPKPLAWLAGIAFFYRISLWGFDRVERIQEREKI